MAAAWLISQRHAVTVYEREARIGGHTHTVDVATARGVIPVDIGFIVYNEQNYPNLAALLAHLGVKTKPSNLGFSVSLDGGDLEYAGSFSGLIAQPANFLRRDYRAMLRDTLRFYREAHDLLDAASFRGTLGEYLDTNGYTEAFARIHLLPMGAAIWSSSLADMRAYPATSFAQFFANHGLLKLFGRPQWRTVEGGSREYVKKLTAGYAKDIRLNSAARVVARSATGVTIRDGNGTLETFDGVVIAAHADDALAMLGDPSVEERTLLQSFGYRPNRVVLHSDRLLMPRRRMAWASWNYMAHSQKDGTEDLCVTYWMNKLQGIDKNTPLFVTLNPASMPREDLIHGVYCCRHPLFDLQTISAQQRLWHLQGERRTWFCGSYFGAGFHEDALQAGLAAAEDATEMRRPWKVARESGRIFMSQEPARLGSGYGMSEV